MRNRIPMMINLLKNAAYQELNVVISVKNVSIANEIYDRIRDTEPSVKIDMVHDHIGRRIISLNNRYKITPDITVSI